MTSGSWGQVHTAVGELEVQPGPDQASLLSLAMGLTTILTTIGVCPPKYA